MNEHMDMVGHHTPRKQFVAFIVKVKHSVLGKLGNTRITQMTFTYPAIKILFQFRPFLSVVLNLQKVFPFAATGFRH